MLFSFIVPVYNVNPMYFTQCIESLAAQKEKCEIIVVDDGSKNENADVYDSIVSRYSNARIYHTENKGVSHARNLGIEKITGEWFFFVDADDWVEFNLTEKIKKTIDDKFDIVLFDAFINKSSKQAVNKFWDSDEIIFEGKSKTILQLQAISKGAQPSINPKYNTVGVACSKCYKTAFIKEKGLRLIEGMKVCEDTLFNLYAFEYAETIKYISIPLYHYRKNDESVTGSFRKDRWSINDKIFYEMSRFSEITDNEKSSEFRERYTYMIINIVLYMIQNYVFNKNNESDISKKKNDFKKLYLDEPYASAIKQANGRYLGLKNRIMLFIMRHHMFLLAMVYCQIINILKCAIKRY